ncbi:copper resistance protein NlpE N-terminal domain-containing protein [Chitinophaga arvensicola]|uniref:NlpE N-terminal domain-containing protein n=1 Tax=Chitinophaga arvensicola TaxID=29529 RepID=A0A1I0PUP8_9BACT|nr:copper resistance protein NlpE N-terminal domain-containing protein [Chitinophaga arvensicola]SEW18177.1 NlpE N-terminal domain-containing protein [Chitinophaga arvensicola]
MKKILLLPVLLSALAACNNNTTTSGSDSSVPHTPSATRTAPVLTGTYQGTLPCADCPGMDYQISLFDDHTFSELVAYQGRGQSIASVETGTWKQTSDSTVVIQKKTDSSSFLSAEGKLLLLDTKGKRIEGVLASNYILKPVEGGDRRQLLAEKSKVGIRFTANGNEPGWTLDLDKQKLRFRNMNGDSLQVSLPPAQPNTDTLKVYTAPGITVSIRNTMCADDMSGLMKPNTVQVQVKDKTYQGCGEYIK